MHLFLHVCVGLMLWLMDPIQSNGCGLRDEASVGFCTLGNNSGDLPCFKYGREGELCRWLGRHISETSVCWPATLAPKIASASFSDLFGVLTGFEELPLGMNKGGLGFFERRAARICETDLWSKYAQTVLLTFLQHRAT